MIRSHRQLTCTLVPWLFKAQRITFRLYRGLSKSTSSNYSSSSTTNMLSDNGLIDVPGDLRHNWSEVARTENSLDTSFSGVPFDFWEGWQSAEPTRSVIGDGTAIQIQGFGFDPSATYVCAFSRLGTENVSGFRAEHQAAALVTNSTHLTCTPSSHIGEATFPVSLLSLFSVDSGGALKPLTKEGPPRTFVFLSAFTSISPTAAVAQQESLQISKHSTIVSNHSLMI